MASKSDKGKKTTGKANNDSEKEPQKKPAAKSKATTSPKKGLKNPATVEVVSNYSNYAFTKRWIKEALVAEGLLDKIYKNNELDADTNAKIQAAINQLRTLSKYQ